MKTALKKRDSNAHHPCRERRVKVECCITPLGDRATRFIKALIHSSQEVTALKGKYVLLRALCLLSVSLCVYLEFIAKGINRKTSVLKDLVGFVTATDREAHISIQI